MKTRTRITWLLLSLAASSANAGSIYSYAGADAYELTPLGGDESEALDVNADNDVVGWARLPSGVIRAFRSVYGAATNLTPGLPDYVASYAQSVNEFGEVVGYYENPLGTAASSSAFYWVQGGWPDPFLTLPPGESTGFRARAINNNGRMVGEKYGVGPVPYSQPSCFGTMPVSWLYAYGDPYSFRCVEYGNELRFTGLNDNYGYVGWEKADASSEYRAWIIRSPQGHGFVPKPAAGLLPKGATSACGMKANAISNNDSVVGTTSICFPSSTAERAFYWNGESSNSKLIGVLPGGNSSQALDVNDGRIVVGWSEQFLNGGGFLPDTIRKRAFVYQSTMGMVALPLPPGFFPSVTDCAANAASQAWGNDEWVYFHAAGYCTKSNKKKAVYWTVALHVQQLANF